MPRQVRIVLAQPLETEEEPNLTFDLKCGRKYLTVPGFMRHNGDIALFLDHVKPLLDNPKVRK